MGRDTCWWARLCGVMALAIFMSACVGVRVKYIVEPKEDENGLIKFRLAGSMVTVAQKDPDPNSKTGFLLNKTIIIDNKNNDKKSDADYFLNVGGVVTQIAGSKEEFAVVPHDPFWQKTTISHTYIDASDRLLKDLGVEVTDYRKQIIEAGGTVAKVALIGALGEAPPSSRNTLILPVAIEIMPVVEVSDWRELPNNTTNGNGWWYRVTIQRPENSGVSVVDHKKHRSKSKGSGGGKEGDKDASIAPDHFFEKFRNAGGDATDVFPVSSCRTAVLAFQRSNGKPTQDASNQPQIKATVADPRAIDTVAIPTKGAIKFKGVCGADVESQPSNDASWWQLLKEASDQAKAVRDAQKEAEGKKQ